MLLSHDNQTIVHADAIQSVVPFDEPMEDRTVEPYRLLFVLSGGHDAEWSFATAEARDGALARLRDRLGIENF